MEAGIFESVLGLDQAACKGEGTKLTGIVPHGCTHVCVADVQNEGHIHNVIVAWLVLRVV